MLEIKHVIITHLINDGFNFERNAYQLSLSELTEFKQLAKKVNYKGTKTHSLGFSFYRHLQKLYNKR
jgi:hypothetical protein